MEIAACITSRPSGASFHWYVVSSRISKMAYVNSLVPTTLCGLLTLKLVLQNNRPESCLAVLKRIHADVKDPEGHFAMREYHVMQQQFTLDSSFTGGSYKSLLVEPHNRKRVFIGFMTMFGAQCTGTLVINSKHSFDLYV